MFESLCWPRGASALLLAAILALLVACQETTPSASNPPIGPKEIPISEPVPEATGKLLYVKSGEFWTFEPSTKSMQQIAVFPDRTFPAGPALSPNGDRVAFGLYRLGKDAQDPGGGDLFVMATDGSQQQLVLAHDLPGASLGEPAWAPDGQTLYFTRRALEGEVQIERVRLDGSERSVVVENAQSPSLSANGQELVYVTTDPETYANALWIATPDGKNARRLVGNPEFEMLAVPHLAANGDKVVFAAVGGSAPPSTTYQDNPVGRLGAWLGPSVARAHGIPWDLWLINANGTGLRRITSLNEDSPTPVWSPDEKWIAFAGELGLYLVDVEGQEVIRLSDEFATGGLTWISRG